MTTDLDENLIDIEGVTKAVMPELQSPRIFGAKLDAPQSDGFVADCDPAFSEQILNIAVTKIEAIVKLDGEADDFGRKSVSFVCNHPQIIGYGKLS